MKDNRFRKVAIAAAVALSFAPILPRMGRALAQTISDFSLTSGKAEVTYETASCENENETSSIISCQAPLWDSDSYEVNAAANVTDMTELGQDVTTNGLVLAFLSGTDCSALESGNSSSNSTGDLISLQVIPGNAVHTTTNRKWTIYSFEGNVPQFAAALHKEAQTFPGTYDHLEMNLKILNSDPANSSLHVEGNADFCDWTNSENPVPLTGQPVSMVFDIAGLTEGISLDNDTDLGCVDLMPEYKTRDVSSAACVSLP